MKYMISTVCMSLLLMGAGCTSHIAQQMQQDVVEKRSATQEDILGAWQINDSLYIEFQQDVYYTYEDQLPRDFGLWTYASGTLSLDADSNAAEDQTYGDVTVHGAELILQSGSSSDAWLRIVQ